MIQVFDGLRPKEMDKKMWSSYQNHL